mmetsp:Transcript_17491/g.47903  ORF Transcript_17491/g.47903 Transcript_17491/m.47903 type:complete len:206 (-) Transcript_17491:31-648(-)
MACRRRRLRLGAASRAHRSSGCEGQRRQRKPATTRPTDAAAACTKRVGKPTTGAPAAVLGSGPVSPRPVCHPYLEAPAVEGPAAYRPPDAGPCTRSHAAQGGSPGRRKPERPSPPQVPPPPARPPMAMSCSASSKRARSSVKAWVALARSASALRSGCKRLASRKYAFLRSATVAVDGNLKARSSAARRRVLLISAQTAQKRLVR